MTTPKAATNTLLITLYAKNADIIPKDSPTIKEEAGPNLKASKL